MTTEVTVNKSLKDSSSPKKSSKNYLKEDIIISDHNLTSTFSTSLSSSIEFSGESTINENTDVINKNNNNLTNINFLNNGIEIIDNVFVDDYNKINKNETQNSITNSENFSQSQSPTSSLPPLPGLIPIRKANIVTNPYQNKMESSLTLSKKKSSQKCGVGKTKNSVSIKNNSFKDSKNIHNNNNNNINKNNNIDSISSRCLIKTALDKHSQEKNNKEAGDILTREIYQSTNKEKSLSAETEISIKDNSSLINNDGFVQPIPNIIEAQNENIIIDKNNLDNQSTPSLSQSNDDVQAFKDKPKRGRKIKIKAEIMDGAVIEDIIPHRKSDRRRIARDIFFLIEEYPTTRRRKTAKSANGKSKKSRGRPKSKFAHLRAKNNTSILRHQDNENRSIFPDRKQVPIESSQKELPQVLEKASNSVSSTDSKSIKPDKIDSNIEKLSKSNCSKTSGFPNKINKKDVTQPARVNPIFVWVKQDDTRIVEVRCEDYDKRNRIRLTKTPSGWRAIPRTDPTTSRFAKLCSNPLIKIKQEQKENLDLLTISTSSKDSSGENSTYELNEYSSVAMGSKSKKKKKKKKKKKRKHNLADEEHKERLVLKIPALPAQSSFEQPIETKSLTQSHQPHLSPFTPNNEVIVFESTNHERNETDQLIEKSETPKSHENIDIITSHHNSFTNNVLIQRNEETIDLENASTDLTKNLTVLSDDDIEMQIPQFMVHHPDKEFNGPLLPLCTTSSIFDQLNNQNCNQIQQEESNECANASNEHNRVELPDSFDASDVDSKHLKDLLDDADLLQHCENAMSGVELIDSLVKRGCEDNHISGDDEHNLQNDNKIRQENLSEINNSTTICLTDDFDNENDELLMQPEPVEDIISRLGESLTASPKCLSFNEAGEIEDLHGELFQTNIHSDPFNRTALEELSITIKDLEKSSDNFIQQRKENKLKCSTTIVSPDSCADEFPKDLTCKKRHQASLTSVTNTTEIIEIDRSISRSSDAIQSPQPSGLPSIPPSPELMSSKNKAFLDQFIIPTSSTSPKHQSALTVTPITVSTSKLQKEPLDLGKHRKSASPTVSCSEEANQTTQPKPSIVTIDLDNIEPSAKRVKREQIHQNKNNSESLLEMFTSGKDPDALTQLRLLISNPEWKVPDPILVPKDRLNAILASPAREIPLLLTTRPELRLPEAFAYPAILQDPDILVISMAQLDSILEKQIEVAPKPKVTPVLPQVTIEAVSNKNIESSNNSNMEQPVSNSIQIPKKSTTSNNASLLNPLSQLLTAGLACDIDAATTAAFNQMLWLPYLGQIAPELLKSMTGVQNKTSNNISNLAELLPLLAQQQVQQQQNHCNPFVAAATAAAFSDNDLSAFNPAAAVAAALQNSLAFQNPLEMAMWQAQMQRAFKIQNQTAAAAQREQAKKNESNLNAQRNLAALFATQKMAGNSKINEIKQKSQQLQLSQKSRSMIGINPFRQEHNRTQLRNPGVAITMETINSSPAEKNTSSMQSLNPFHQNYDQGSVDITPVIRESKQNQQNNIQNTNNLEQKPRVTCKSLTNLLQPNRCINPLADTKMTNLLAMPAFDYNLLPVGNSLQRQNNANNNVNLQHNNFHQGQLSAYSSSSTSSNQQTQHRISQNNSSNSEPKSKTHQNNNHGKLKVKSGSHLLDPTAQRRFLNCDDNFEVGSTTVSLDEMMMTDPNSALWHPLFGSAQKSAYNSPWQWTTVTATGE